MGFMRKAVKSALGIIFVCILSLASALWAKWDFVPYGKEFQTTAYFLKRVSRRSVDEYRDHGIVRAIRALAGGMKEAVSTDELIVGLQHHMRIETIELESVLPQYLNNGLMPPGYLTILQNKTIIFTSAEGKLYRVDSNDHGIKEIESNLPDRIRRQKYTSIDSITKDDMSKRLGVKSLLADTVHNQLYVSYHKKLREPNCYVMGVDVAQIPAIDSLNGLMFKDFYIGNYCVSNFNGHDSGGRLALRGDEVIFTVGAFDTKDPIPLRDFKNDLGSVVSISRSGIGTILSKGHRNDAGLAISNGNIFISEHGPMGGDQFSQIRPGSTYGWPTHSYGFEYGYTDDYKRPMGPMFAEPTFYFTPSIAPSQLIFYTGNEFPRFKGKFILSTLKNMSLYILDYREKEDRVVSIEQYEIGHRIRDLTQDVDGVLYLLTDDSKLIIARRAASDIPMKANM